ncbi:MAG: polyprenyl synthetase family protein [Thermoplasmatales archaeon]|nr:polyprenyl synthetase family protein [Thermoplasmatales archaeon]
MEYLEEIRIAIDKGIENYLYEMEPKNLYDAVKHLPFAGGKRLRPIIAFISCEAVGGRGEDTIPFGVALELIHTFTLIHDDIMDKDEERRGKPTVHKLFGENTAIMAGDALFAKSFEIASQIENDKIAKRILRNLAIMAKEICEGQDMDMSFEKMEYVDEKKFLEMIEKKTAKMFEHASMGGAIIGRAKEKEIEALRNYGLNLGMAFQIWDDCLDVIGKNIGKPVGSDIRRGKKTILYIYAYKKDRERLLKNYGKESEEDVKKAISFLEEIGAIDYAKNMAFSYVEKAKRALEKIKNSEEKKRLIEIAEFAVKREK